MPISEKENMFRLYRHEMPEFLPSPAKAMHMFYEVNGFHERPPFNKGGTDWFGVDWIYGESGGAPVPDHKQPPILKEISEWHDKITFPDLDAWDWEQAVKLDKVESLDRENKMINIMLFSGPFERLHMLMGFENALFAMMEEPEEVSAFFDALMDYKCKLIDKIAEHYKPDVINFHDDWGTQKSMFFSPDIWRDMIKPQIVKAVEACHRNGIFFEMHSCGKVERIVPEFVEMGIDSFQGMGINDIPALKRLTGGKLLYTIVPDYQRYSADSNAGSINEEELRKDIRGHVMACAEGGCYVASLIPSDDWWFPIVKDEINNCRKVLYK
ncbi:MAG: hypothetical protein HGA22_01730 [Clostridiales bacterium]|nr:hypothetical protein [Clostridiales bacterium]